MKGEVIQILGQSIKGAAIKHNRLGAGGPASMLWLVLDNDDIYEFYSSLDGLKPVWVGISEKDDPVTGAPEIMSLEALLAWGGDQAENEIVVWQDEAGRHWRKYGDEPAACVFTPETPAR